MRRDSSGAERFDEWASVASLDARTLNEALEVRLLGSPSFRGLKEVNGVSLEALTAVTRVRGPLPWWHLGVIVQVAPLIRLPMPSLTSLRIFNPITGLRLRELLASSLGRQLTALTFRLFASAELDDVLNALMTSRICLAKGSSAGGDFTFDVARKTLRARREFFAGPGHQRARKQGSYRSQRLETGQVLTKY